MFSFKTKALYFKGTEKLTAKILMMQESKDYFNRVNFQQVLEDFNNQITQLKKDITILESAHNEVTTLKAKIATLESARDEALAQEEELKKMEPKVYVIEEDDEGNQKVVPADAQKYQEYLAKAKSLLNKKTTEQEAQLKQYQKEKAELTTQLAELKKKKSTTKGSK